MGLKVSEIVDGFFSFLGFTRITSANIIQKAIARGVQEGIFGYYTGTPPVLGDDGKFQVNVLKVVHNRIVAEDEIDLDLGFIMLPEAIPMVKPAETPIPGEPPPPPPPPGAGEAPPGPEPEPETPTGQPSVQKSVSLTFSANRDAAFWCLVSLSQSGRHGGIDQGNH